MLMNRIALSRLVVCFVSICLATWTTLFVACQKKPESTQSTKSDPQSEELAEATIHEVKDFCGFCHGYPPPEAFPRERWFDEVEQGYELSRIFPRGLRAPPQARVARHYLKRAPEELPLLKPVYAATASSTRFERQPIVPATPVVAPSLAHIRAVSWTRPDAREAIVCEMYRGEISLIDFGASPPGVRLLSKDVAHPGHVEVVDLDGDGHKDLLVANLGNFFPTDEKRGSVVWLRGTPDGKLTPHTLLVNVGRVADVQAGDFDRDGDLDLIVAAFGWRKVGEVIHLENRTTDWSKPTFSPRVVDPRHGAIHVPVVDLNGDGNLDFIVLLSQEYESVFAYLGDGKGSFRQETIFRGAHPALGSSGIQVIDLDKDGKLDVLMTNGDALDKTLLRPYHGIRWLRNTGPFPFEERELAAMYGVHRALATDFDGDGDLDIVAVALLPEPGYTDLRKKYNLDAIILLEQTGPGVFVRHRLESEFCDHATAEIGDFDGDGRIDFLTGAFSSREAHVAKGETVPLPSRREWLSAWLNRRPLPGRPASSADTSR
jgi:hypothetical protein